MLSSDSIRKCKMPLVLGKGFNPSFFAHWTYHGNKRWSVTILGSEGKNGLFPLPWLTALWDRGWVTAGLWHTMQFNTIFYQAEMPFWHFTPPEEEIPCLRHKVQPFLGTRKDLTSLFSQNMWFYFRASDKLYISSFADLAFLILGHRETFWLYQAGVGTCSILA